MYRKVLSNDFNPEEEIYKTNLAVLVKERNYRKNDMIEKVSLIGDVNNQICIIVDDIVDSGSTLIKAAEALKKNGALGVYAYITHGLMNDGFADRILDSVIDKIFVTNSTNVYDKIKDPK